MSADLPLRGAGGGSGSSKPPPAPYEAPNSLITTNTLRTLHLIGEGVLEGLVDGGRSIYLNDTPLIAADGSANVQGVGWEWRDGSPGQAPIEGFPTVETPLAVGVEVSTTNGPVTRTVNLTAIDRLRIIVQVNGLLEQRDNGDLVGSEVRYRVDYRATGSTGAWTVAFDDTISGKTTSQYQRSVSFSVAGRTGSHDIRVTKLTADSTISKLVNGLFWFNITTILDQKLSYPGSALIGLALDAKNLSGSVPTLTFEVKGLRCWVPSNYDPATRLYATSGPGTSGGMWDGSFQRAYTDNPAWIAYTLCVEPDFGIGREIGAAGVDKWSLYAIAQYCDELVPDGFGGAEPRYSFNAVINQRDEAFRVLQAVASSFRAMVYWGGGQVVFVADRPASPVKLVTPANVMDGRFEYEGASLKVRHSVAKIRWRDPSLGYRIAVEVVDDAALIAEVGIREIEIDGIGVTSRGLARRLGRWILYSEQYETDILRYRAAFDHADVRPGQVILVQDPSLAAVAFSGRLAAVGSATSVTLDRAVTLTSGQSYALRVALPDGSISDPLPVTTPAGSATTVTLAAPGLPAPLPAAGAVWTLVASNVAPTQWRIISVAEEADGSYAVTALRHYPGKYALVEQGLALSDDPFTLYPRSPTTPLAPPENVVATEFIGGIGDTALLGVTVSWTPASDPRVTGYEVQAVQAGRVAYEAATSTRTSIDFRDMVAGTYVFQVRSVGADQVSTWAATGEIMVDGRADPPTAPTSLAAQGAIRQNIVTWTTPTGRHYRTTEIWASSTSSFAAGGKVGESDRGQFLHTGLLPNTARWYWVRAADAFGQFSAWVGPVSATTSLLVAADITDGILSTAKFAASIKPVAVPATSGELAALRTADQLVYPQATLTDSLTGQALTAGRLYRWTGTAWFDVVSAAGVTGQLTNAQIADLAAAKLTGQITTTQITDSAISTAKLAAGAVSTAKLAAGAVTADTIASNAITAVKLAASAVTADKVAANAITAGKIAAGAISSTEIAAGAIRATNLAAETLITQSGQIGSLVVDTLQINNGAVTTAAAVVRGDGVNSSSGWQVVASMSAYLPQTRTGVLTAVLNKRYNWQSVSSWGDEMLVRVNGGDVAWYGSGWDDSSSVSMTLITALSLGTGWHGFELLHRAYHGANFLLLHRGITFFIAAK